MGYSQVLIPSKTNADTLQNTSDTLKNHFKEVSGQDTVLMKNESGLETVVTIVASDSSWNQVKQKNIIQPLQRRKSKIPRL